MRDGHACLPGLGTFVTEEVPAQFSEKGFTINPPYLKIEFRTDMPQELGLVDFYCKANEESSNVAREVIIDYIASLGKQLYQLKNLDFPGLGRLRAARGGAVIFVPDEDLSIFPQYDCLEPVSLRFRPEPVMGLASDDLPAEDVPIEETPAEEVLADDVAAEETPTTVEAEETIEEAPSAAEESVEESAGPAVEESAEAIEESPSAAEEMAEAIDKTPVAEEAPSAEDTEMEAIAPAEPATEESAEESAESAAEEMAEAIDKTPVAEEATSAEDIEMEAIAPAEPAVEESAETIEESPSATEESVGESAEPAVEETSEASAAETAESPSADTDETAETPSNPAKTFWIGVLVLVILAALFFAAVAIIGRTYPDLIDPYLYTPSELKILRAKL